MIGWLLFLVPYTAFYGGCIEGFLDGIRAHDGIKIEHKKSFIIRCCILIVVCVLGGIFTYLSWWFWLFYGLTIGFIYWIPFDICANIGLRVHWIKHNGTTSKLDRVFGSATKKTIFKLIALTFLLITTIKLL